MNGTTFTPNPATTSFYGAFAAEVSPLLIDPHTSAIIPPVLLTSTVLRGSSSDMANAVAVANGTNGGNALSGSGSSTVNMYLTGVTTSLTGDSYNTSASDNFVGATLFPQELPYICTGSTSSTCATVPASSSTGLNPHSGASENAFVAMIQSAAYASLTPSTSDGVVVPPVLTISTRPIVRLTTAKRGR